MGSDLYSKNQWANKSPKVHGDLKVILGRLDVEKIDFDDAESIRESAAECIKATNRKRRVESSESQFEEKILNEIRSLVDMRTSEFFYLFFQPADYKGVYKVRSGEVLAFAWKLLTYDGNIISFVSSDFRFGFLLDLEFFEGGLESQIELEVWQAE